MRIPSPSMFDFVASLKGVEEVAGTVKELGSGSELALKLFSDSHPPLPGLKTTSIPLHNEHDLLPAGEHPVAFPDFANSFGYTPDRRLMIEGLVYGAQPLIKADVPVLQIGGRFIRNNAVPRDIDTAWSSQGADTQLIKDLEPSFMSGIWRQQKAKFGGEFRRDDMHILRGTYDGKPAGVLNLDLSTVPRVEANIGPTWFEDTINARAESLHQQANELAKSSNPHDALPVYASWLRRSEEQLAIRPSPSLLKMPEINDGATLLGRYRQVHKFIRDIGETPPPELDTRIRNVENILKREATRATAGGVW